MYNLYSASTTKKKERLWLFILFWNRVALKFVDYILRKNMPIDFYMYIFLIYCLNIIILDMFMMWYCYNIGMYEINPDINILTFRR